MYSEHIGNHRESLLLWGLTLPFLWWMPRGQPFLVRPIGFFKSRSLSSTPDLDTVRAEGAPRLKKNQLIEGLEQRREQKKALFALGVCSNFSTNETSRIFWQIPEQNFKLGILGQSLLSYNLPLLTCLLSAYLLPSLQSKSRELWLRVWLSAKYLWLANDNMVLINLFTEIIWYRKRSAFLAEKLCVCFWHCTYIIAGSGSHQPSKMKSLHESLMKKTTFLSDGSPSGFVCTGAPNRNQHLLKALIWQHRTVV